MNHIFLNEVKFIKTLIFIEFNNNQFNFKTLTFNQNYKNICKIIRYLIFIM